jgi:hypothetical protein
MALNRVRQTPIETSASGGFEAPELGDDGLLPFLDNEKSGAQPNQCSHGSDDDQAKAGIFHVGLEATATWAASATAPARFAAAEQAAQLAVEITPQLIQIGWTCIGP